MQSDWQPSCSLELLTLRAECLQAIRSFFYEQGVLEVETPILGHFSGTDPYIDCFQTHDASLKTDFYLQSSPEFAMKRLLASGSGSIYQMTKAFRQNESGRFHNPEFSILEWYRVGFNLEQLMADVEVLLERILPQALLQKPTEKIKYCDVFKHYTGLNALDFDIECYKQCAEKYNLSDAHTICGKNHAAWLEFLFDGLVQPSLGLTEVCMVYNYPACLPSLARRDEANPLIVSRVEVFIKGIEVGNGFFELTDADEQNQRFEQDLLQRQQNNSTMLKKDRYFLSALESGLPSCAGIALGLDRLLMLISEASHIKDVLAFPIETA